MSDADWLTRVDAGCWEAVGRASSFAALVPLPVFSSGWRVRVVIASMLALLLVACREHAVPETFRGAAFAEAVAHGATLAFAIRAVSAAIGCGAALIDQQIGIAVPPDDVDELGNASASTRLYSLTALAVLFACDGHRVIVAALSLPSPPGRHTTHTDPTPVSVAPLESPRWSVVLHVVEASARIMQSGTELVVQVAGPAICAFLAGTIANALAARTIPKLALSQSWVAVQLVVWFFIVGYGVVAVSRLAALSPEWLDAMLGSAAVQ